jgi:Membrane domain of glycerophosphoryl diester phosphodiesterase
MANTSVPVSRMVDGDVRLGRIFDRAISIYTRNFLLFSAVTLIAYAPLVFLTPATGNSVALGAPEPSAMLIPLVFLFIGLVFLSQAILIHASFQDMRGRPVNIFDSLNVSLTRLVPLIGLGLLIGLAVVLAIAVISIVAGLGVAMFGGGPAGAVIGGGMVVVGVVAMIMLVVRWFSAVPACMVERLGPVKSLRRSSQLTKGHRWKIFGALILLYLVSAVVGVILSTLLGKVGGFLFASIATLMWNGVWGAFFAIFIVVTYHDLRSAKEGIDTNQIAAVFD